MFFGKKGYFQINHILYNYIDDVN